MNTHLEILVKELIKNGVSAKCCEIITDNEGNVSASEPFLDFSEHDKTVAKEKDNRIDSLQEEVWKLKELLMKKSAEQCQKINNAEEESQKLRDELKKQMNRNIELINEIDEIKKDWCFARMSELEDRHQSDCIRINQLFTTIDVLTERYQKLREVHGL